VKIALSSTIRGLNAECDELGPHAFLCDKFLSNRTRGSSVCRVAIGFAYQSCIMPAQLDEGRLTPKPLIRVMHTMIRLAKTHSIECLGCNTIFRR
jgi:hypothetical protein